MIVTNHEAKAIVLGSMESGRSYSATELHRELFLKPQGDEPAHEGSPSTQLDYCEQSLEPAGCVERSPAATVEYRLTDLGKRKGQPWVGHALSLSLESGDISLRSLYGMTRTSRGRASRPPSDRLRIFRMLLASDNLQASDVQAELGVSSGAAVNNLVWLDTDGIVEYHAVNGRDAAENLVYGLPSEFPYDGVDVNGNGRSAMRKMVHATVEQLVAAGERECSLAGLIAILKEQYPDEGFDRPNKRSHAVGMMNELAADGRISKGALGGGRKSSITLRDEARPIVEDQSV